MQGISIPAKLREAGKEVTTKRPALQKITNKGKEGARRIIQKYMGSVFSDRVGKMKVKPVKLRYKKGFKPVQPARYPVPYHYHTRLDNHLKQQRISTA